MDIRAFLEQVGNEQWYHQQIVHMESIPSHPPVYGELEHPLHPSLSKALVTLGIERIYSHQSQAINALLRGENVIVSTASASGKSLCYQVPVIQSLLQDRTSYALYLFPTKALSQDQRRSMKALTNADMKINAAVYDGDTHQEERSSIRRHTRVLITNPDMLHLGVLPNHRSWARLLTGLQYVVVDEAHVYRGIFGSHMANILRRLRRLCNVYGSSPRFIMCSATIANPRELAEKLVGLPFREVTEDGSPHGGKEFLLWNPPLVDESKGRRRSPASEATLLFSELLKRQIRTITFVRTRRMAELIYVYTRDQLKSTHPHLVARIAPYRASYLPEERRQLERGLLEGQLMGLSTTNALELGIDIGALDATIITGYPGTIASTWQQAGRSGRRGSSSLSVLVARDDPLDQYLMRHPEAFFGRSHESALISPENPYLLKSHLLCAAYEKTLTPGDEAYFGSSLTDRVKELVDSGSLRQGDRRWYLSPGVSYPAEEVNIRSTSPDNYTVVEVDSGRILEVVEEAAAFNQLHPGAIYLHRGEPYQVKELDLTSRTAYVSLADVPYYTQARELTDLRIIQVHKDKRAGASHVFLGEVEVSTQVVAYKKLAHYTEEVLDEGLVELPPHRFRTIALWFDVPEAALIRIRAGRLDLAGGLHAAEHAAIGVLPLFAMCDRNDIGGVSTPLQPDTGRPQVFIYDGHPGGIGISEKGYDIIESLWDTTLKAVAECRCEQGCPSCIQSPKCGNNNQPLDKEVAALFLRSLLGKM